MGRGGEGEVLGSGLIGIRDWGGGLGIGELGIDFGGEVW